MAERAGRSAVGAMAVKPLISGIGVGCAPRLTPQTPIPAFRGERKRVAARESLNLETCTVYADTPWLGCCSVFFLCVAVRPSLSRVGDLACRFSLPSHPG